MKNPLTAKKLIKFLPAGEGEILLSKLLKKPREYFLTYPDTPVPFLKTIIFLYRAVLRFFHWPLAYLTKEKEFCGFDFFVNRAVLVPRQETELLVEKIVEKIKKNDADSHVVCADIGTGSGCIAISACLKSGQPKNAFFFASDISRSALKTAKKNSLTRGTKIYFARGNLAQPLAEFTRRFSAEKFSLIISANLPYLTSEQIKKETSIKREPKLALFGGQDGLSLYEKMFKQLPMILSQAKEWSVLIEIDPDQTKKIPALAEILPPCSFKIEKDLSGQNRVAIFEKSS